MLDPTTVCAYVEVCVTITLHYPNNLHNKTAQNRNRKLMNEVTKAAGFNRLNEYCFASVAMSPSTLSSTPISPPLSYRWM